MSREVNHTIQIKMEGRCLKGWASLACDQETHFCSNYRRERMGSWNQRPRVKPYVGIL